MMKILYLLGALAVVQVVFGVACSDTCKVTAVSATAVTTESACPQDKVGCAATEAVLTTKTKAEAMKAANKKGSFTFAAWKADQLSNNMPVSGGMWKALSLEAVATDKTTKDYWIYCWGNDKAEPTTFEKKIVRAAYVAPAVAVTTDSDCSTVASATPSTTSATTITVGYTAAAATSKKMSCGCLKGDTAPTATSSGVWKDSTSTATAGTVTVTGLAENTSYKCSCKGTGGTLKSFANAAKTATRVAVTKVASVAQSKIATKKCVSKVIETTYSHVTVTVAALGKAGAKITCYTAKTFADLKEATLKKGTMLGSATTKVDTQYYAVAACGFTTTAQFVGCTVGTVDGQKTTTAFKTGAACPSTGSAATLSSNLVMVFVALAAVLFSQ